MSTRFFLLLERLQRLDALVRLARSRQHANPLEIARLRARKLFVRERLARLSAHSVVHPA